MDQGLRVLSEITTWSKYAKFLPEKGRREVYNEIIYRYRDMMIKRYPNLKDSINLHIDKILNKKVLPSMRALQFAGPAIEANEARSYNCCFMHIDSYHSFSETMFLLLSGCGVGYSVQKHHVAKLPPINVPLKKRKFLIEDSIIGWADAIKVLMKSYFTGSSLPNFDYSSIRPKGSRLVTAGGKAPGPGPLKLCIAHISSILEAKNNGDKLSTLECHDILCHIANAVLSGGIRRAAMISLFSIDDEDMLTCKFGAWWELNEQRGRSNNSAIIDRNNISKEEFLTLWKKIELSGSGEPGWYWTNDIELGSNPCCEVSLKAYQFCNLCEINGSDIESQQDLNDRAITASLFGTLQAGFTDFHYLRDEWKTTTEAGALLGIGITGIASNKLKDLSLSEAAQNAVDMNIGTAPQIGINPADRVTVIKPSGTTSCILGCSSGIHAWHDPYFLRTVRFNLSESIASYLMKTVPEICELDILRPHDTLCVRIPIKAPDNAINRDESTMDFLDRTALYNKEWIKTGHIKGENSNNVSATVSVKSDEWKEVGEWMWNNRFSYNGLSILPYDGGTYTQAPFETISEEEYHKRIKYLKDINTEDILELEDNVSFSDTVACAGGACEIS